MCVRDCSRVILSFAPLFMPLLLCWIWFVSTAVVWRARKMNCLTWGQFCFSSISFHATCVFHAVCLCKQVTGKKCYDVSISSACRWRTVTHIPRTRWHSTKQEWLECFHNVTKYKKRFMAMSKNRRNPQTQCPKITANIGNIVSSNLITWVHQIHVLSMLRVCATHWIWSTRRKSIEQNQ